MAVAVQVIRGAVDGVDDPGKAVAQLLVVSFFCQNAAVRQQLAAFRHNELLAFHVDVGNQVGGAALFGDLADLVIPDEGTGVLRNGDHLPGPELSGFGGDHGDTFLSCRDFFIITGTGGDCHLPFADKNAKKAPGAAGQRSAVQTGEQLRQKSMAERVEKMN